MINKNDHLLRKEDVKNKNNILVDCDIGVLILPEKFKLMKEENDNM